MGRLNASLGQLARSTGLDKIGRGLWRLGAAATEAARRMMSMVPIQAPSLVSELWPALLP